MSNTKEQKITQERRVIMARSVAKQWVEARLKGEHRIRLYHSASSRVRNLPTFLKLFRDGKTASSSLDPIPDMGIEEKGDTIVVWSSNHEALLKLSHWLEKRGVETSGIW